MSWPITTFIPGAVFDAVQGNAYLRDPLTDLRAGAIAMTGQLANDALFATSATQWGRGTPAAGSIPKFNGTTWELVQPLDLAWPVGSVFRSAVATNPATLIGVGTWTAFGSGRVTVSFDDTQIEFDTVLKTGGANTVIVSVAELPVHTHVQDAHNHTQNAHDHTLSGVGNDTGPIDSGVDGDAVDDTGTMVTNDTTATNIAATATNQATGGNGAHTNLMPFVVCYAWRRTA